MRPQWGCALSRPGRHAGGTRAPSVAAAASRREVWLKNFMRWGSVGLLSTASAACGGGRDETAITISRIGFVPMAGSEVVVCGDAYAALGSSGETAELADLRLYVSDVRLHSASGRSVPVTLVQDGIWQYGDVALLDLEDGTDGCAESGNPELNVSLRVIVPPGEYRGLSFELGVPFELNHADAAASPAPLNVREMSWAGQVGRKFARIDWGVGDARWNFHLGSTECESGGPMDPPASECGRANRPRVSLTGFDPLAERVVLDLQQLFEGTDLSANLPDTPAGCQSSPREGGDCRSAFEKLGLDFDTGECVSGCEGQALFRSP